LPAGPRAALAALHLTDPRPELLHQLDNKAIRETLLFCDRSQMSLCVRLAAPNFAIEEMASRAEKNRVRLRKIEGTYEFVRRVLAGLDYVALKGITNCAHAHLRPEDRAQYDIDLYLPREGAEEASRRLIAEGYEPLQGMENFPTDHLPALGRREPFEWRGDFFAPDVPFAIEPHYQFWNVGLERLEAPGTPEFWTRRTRRSVGPIEIPCLAAPDAIAYSALHLLKHLLRGAAKPFHVYELARCLHFNAQDTALWKEWETLHAPQLRRVEAVSFLLAATWFGCEYAPQVAEEIERLPVLARTWFDEFAASPATATFLPNKDELWLHLSLLDSLDDRLSVARRRLIPRNLPPPITAAKARGVAYERSEWLRHTARRLRFHALSLITTSVSGARWWWRANTFGSQFWIFLAAAVLFNFALFNFFLLYNFFLTEHGYKLH